MRAVIYARYSSDNQRVESMLEGYAEYYSADLSEKVVRGMTENALKSKYSGGTLPIGCTIDSEQYFQLDPLTAPFGAGSLQTACRGCDHEGNSGLSEPAGREEHTRTALDL